MQLRLIAGWNGFRAGHVFTDYPRGAGRLLIQRGIAEAAEASPRLSLDTLTVEKLRELCRERGLPVYGRKSEIVARLER